MGERAQAGADLDQRLARLRVNGIGDAVDDRFVDQEMLAEALAWQMFQADPVPAIVSCRSQRRLTHLDIGACAQVLGPFGIGLVELLLAQHGARLFAQLLGLQRHLATLQHLDQVHAKARHHRRRDAVQRQLVHGLVELGNELPRPRHILLRTSPQLSAEAASRRLAEMKRQIELLQAEIRQARSKLRDAASLNAVKKLSKQVTELEVEQEAVLALAAGWWGLREVLRRPVVDTLRRAAE